MKAMFPLKKVALATFSLYTLDITVELMQSGSRTFFWRDGLERVAGSPTFRSVGAAVGWLGVNLTHFEII